MSPVPMVSKRVHDTHNPDDSPLDAKGFVGVDPVYQNYANETDKPLEDKGDPETGDGSSKAQGTPSKTGSQKAQGTSSKTGSQKAAAKDANKTSDAL